MGSNGSGIALDQVVDAISMADELVLRAMLNGGAKFLKVVCEPLSVLYIP